MNIFLINRDQGEWLNLVLIPGSLTVHSENTAAGFVCAQDRSSRTERLQMGVEICFVVVTMFVHLHWAVLQLCLGGFRDNHNQNASGPISSAGPREERQGKSLQPHGPRSWGCGLRASHDQGGQALAVHPVGPWFTPKNPSFTRSIPCL